MRRWYNKTYYDAHWSMYFHDRCFHRIPCILRLSNLVATKTELNAQRVI